jgi:cytochrome c oxidase cbb3-type subunit 3
MASKLQKLAFLSASAALTATFLAFPAEQGQAQNQSPNQNQGQNQGPPASQTPLAQPNPQENTPGELYGKFMRVPVGRIIPGNVKVNPNIERITDPQAVTRGMRYFQAFNCAGCHAANGGGGMGRSLSNSVFIYGGRPENIYLTIVQGRVGMPAWGTVLPEHIVWDLVAYVQSISNAPSTQWGSTFSATSPAVEQVPAEFLSTARPWQFTQPFSFGAPPRGTRRTASAQTQSAPNPQASQQPSGGGQPRGTGRAQ